MKYQKLAVLVVFIDVLLVLAQVAGAQQMNMSITAAQQGVLKGDAANGKILVTGYSYEVDSPRDPASGLPTGKRMHKPLVITKEWDSTSPNLFTAMSNNETLKSVVIEFYKAASNPGLGVGMRNVDAFETISLTNASISSIRQYSTTTPTGAEKWIEEVSFVFQKIQIENKAAKTSSIDDWTGVQR